MKRECHRCHVHPQLKHQCHRCPGATETVYGQTTPEASGLASVMLVSWGVSNPLWGLLYDRTRRWRHNDRHADRTSRQRLGRLFSLLRYLFCTRSRDCPRAILGGASAMGLLAACIMFPPQGHEMWLCIGVKSHARHEGTRHRCTHAQACCRCLW